MPTTRPGYIWSGTEWVAIGQEAAVNPFAYQSTAPVSPSTGDIWIDSDETVNSIDSTQFLRWRKTMVGGETSLSGNDDSSLPLGYTPGYEQLYINGVLQVRGQDYTATTGTTVTGLTALVANDTVEVFSAVARAVADVYTQSQSDARFVNRNVGGLNLVIPTSVTVGSGTGSVTANGAAVFTGASSVTVNNCFNSLYENYKVLISINSSVSANQEITMQLTSGGTPNTGGYLLLTSGGSTTTTSSSWATNFNTNTGTSATELTFFQPFKTHNTSFAGHWFYDDGGTFLYNARGGRHRSATSFDGIRFALPNNMTGTVRIYGMNNGA